jgi:hypothetical protein
VTDAQQTIEAAIEESERLQRILKKQSSNQVTAENEKQIVKATALAWFNKHRNTIAPLLGDDFLQPGDDLYRLLLAYAARATRRRKYLDVIKALTKTLSALQNDHVVLLSKPPGAAPAPAPTADTPPAFTPLISDAKMQAILQKRWQECVICVRHGAPLAATVMMGGILEGLLLARINQLPSQAPVHTAAAAPKDKATGKTLQLKDWGLKNFIDVAHELGWITTTAKDIGDVLRDYRNYIHPQKEFSHGISLAPGDADMLWNIAKSMILQILKH